MRTETFDNITLYNADCRDALRSLPDNSIDSVVTDPPYALVSIQKRLGKPGSAPAKDVYGRGAAGFMGKQWDTGEVAFSEEFWAEVLRVLKPGGHVVAFSGTRTYHRMAVAIEDAGFEIRDQCKWMHEDDSERDAFLASLNDEQRAQFVKLFEEHGAGQLSWAYGSGFPKSHDVSKAIDKTRGETQRDLEFCSFMRSCKIGRAEAGRILQEAGLISPNGTMAGHFFAASKAGQPAVATRLIFEALRPHLGVDVPARIEEIIDRAEAEREVVGQKTSGIANKAEGQRHTIGASSSVIVDITAPATDAARQWQGWGTALKPAWEPICLARKPLIGTVAENVLAHGTGALNIDGCRVEGLPSGLKPYTRNVDQRESQAANHKYVTFTDHPAGRWPANIVHDGSDEVLAAFPVTAPAKAGARGIQQRHDVASPATARPKEGTNSIRGVTDNGGSAARFFYCAKASRKDRDEGLSSGDGTRANTHPTVKPTALMQWLCRLVTPPGGVILDPFMGSGSTGKAALLEGFRFIGCEREPPYFDIACRRIEGTTRQPDMFIEPPQKPKQA